MSMNQYEMKPMMDIATKASLDITSYLESLAKTIAVINVENNKSYQKKDIDLLWVYIENNKEHISRLEVKGDTYSRSLNMFLETNSNLEKNTPGCFMYTEADFILYYFIYTGEMNILPIYQCRPWFIKNIDRFQEKKLSTKVNNYGASYTTAGRLVPKQIIREELGVDFKIIPEELRIGTVYRQSAV